jgi:hypothetical protein
VGFLAPSILLGLLAAVLPWLVHLIGKRRAVPIRFAAMQLLLRSERRVAARRRLREILLLLARTGIAAALPLIFARPFTERLSDLPEETLSAQSAVIVLDDSASLRRKAGSGMLFDRARERARTLVRQLSSDSEVALVLASEGSQPRVGELSRERGRLIEAIDSVQCSARMADFTQALRHAALILSSSHQKERRIFVITDLQAAGWGEEAGGGLPAQDPPDVVLLDVAEGQWNNRAVLSVTAAPATELGTGAVIVEAEIGDFSGENTPSLGVTLKVEGTAVTKSFVELPANGRVKKKFVHTLISPGSAHDIEVSIDPDDFLLDDRRMTRLELSRALRVLIINGDARTAFREDESYFLEQSLRTGDRTTNVITSLPDDVSLETLVSYNVVFLANVGEPSPPLATALVRFVESGGGLFLSVGNKVNTAAWNERLGPLLPQPLSLPRTAAALPGQTDGETADDRPAARLAPLDRRHPLLSVFPAQGEGLASARFYKFMLLEPVPDTVGATVILRYESGAPALVERQVGKGRVMLLATTVDREWTDLPIRPGFLPLVQEAARRLAGTSDQVGVSTLLVGQPREIAMTADERRLEVTKPNGGVFVATKDRGAGAKTIAFVETDEPGSYQVRTAGTDGILTPRAGDGFVVNLDPRESNTALLPPERRPDRRTPSSAAGPPPKRRVELWHGLAALLIFFVLAESLLTIKWRRPVVATGRS